MSTNPSAPTGASTGPVTGTTITPSATTTSAPSIYMAPVMYSNPMGAVSGTNMVANRMNVAPSMPPNTYRPAPYNPMMNMPAGAAALTPAPLPYVPQVMPTKSSSSSSSKKSKSSKNGATTTAPPVSTMPVQGSAPLLSAAKKPEDAANKSKNLDNIALPNWSSEEIDRRLSESQNFLKEWSELMDKTGNAII